MVTPGDSHKILLERCMAATDINFSSSKTNFQLMGTAVVVLVATVYIIVFKRLTSSEEENKYEQAHR